MKICKECGQTVPVQAAIVGTEADAQRIAADLSQIGIWQHSTDVAIYWFAARSINGARAAAKEHYSDRPAELLDTEVGDWSRIPDDNLDEFELTVTELKSVLTFRDNLNRLKQFRRPEMFPCFFASNHTF